MAQQNVLNSIPKVVERTGLGRTTLYREIKLGRLRAVKVGARTLVSEEALNDYVTLLESEAQ
jgi:excisionase family DNA binding protein